MSWASYTISIDRDAGAFDILADYYVDGYYDWETYDYYGETEWRALIGGSEIAVGWSGDTASPVISLGLGGEETPTPLDFYFYAENWLNRELAGFDLTILAAAYSTLDLGATGTDRDDVIVTGSGDDTINALGGDDHIDAGEGDDAVSGGAGNDRIDGGAGNDTLAGGAGDDTLNGGDGDDRLNGGAGADVLDGGAGNDTYYVDDAGDAVIEAPGGGSDNVRASVDYVLAAGQEIEFLRVYGAAGLTLTGNELSNYLVGGSGDDTLYGADGDDTLYGGAGADVMDGGAGNDTHYVDDAGDQVLEAPGGGSDTVHASVDYTLAAGLEVEFLRVYGPAGLMLTGNELSNYLIGGAEADALYGGLGDDTLNGGAGADVLDGGAGNDTYYVDNADDVVLEAPGGGSDNVHARVDYTLAAGQEVEFLRAYGSAGRVLGGNELSNYLIGGAGNDRLDGGDGDDRLHGGAGDDVLTGGAGRDILSGGAGADLFAFGNGDFSGTVASNADVILDFSVAEGDRFDLSAVDADTGSAADDAFTFIGGAAFSSAAGELRWFQQAGDTFFAGDVNGDGAADFAVRLIGAHTLSAASFVL